MPEKYQNIKLPIYPYIIKHVPILTTVPHRWNNKKQINSGDILFHRPITSEFVVISLSSLTFHFGRWFKMIDLFVAIKMLSVL